MSKTNLSPNLASAGMFRKVLYPHVFFFKTTKLALLLCFSFVSRLHIFPQATGNRPTFIRLLNYVKLGQILQEKVCFSESQYDDGVAG